MGRTKRSARASTYDKSNDSKKMPTSLAVPIQRPKRLSRNAGKTVDYVALAGGVGKAIKQEPIEIKEEPESPEPENIATASVTELASVATIRKRKDISIPAPAVPKRRQRPSRSRKPQPRVAQKSPASSQKSKDVIVEVEETSDDVAAPRKSPEELKHEAAQDARSRIINKIQKELTVELTKLEDVPEGSQKQGRSSGRSTPTPPTKTKRRKRRMFVTADEEDSNIILPDSELYRRPMHGKIVKVSKHAAVDALEVLKVSSVDVDETDFLAIEDDEDVEFRRSRRQMDLSPEFRPSTSAHVMYPNSLSLRRFASNMGCLSPGHDENDYITEEPRPFSPVKTSLELPPCGKEFCRFGCLCESIDTSTSHVAKHCGRIECIFGCICSEQELPERQSKLNARLRTQSLLQQFRVIRHNGSRPSSKRSSRESSPMVMEIETVDVRRSKRSKARASVHAAAKSLTSIAHGRSSAVSAAEKVVGKAKQTITSKVLGRKPPVKPRPRKRMMSGKVRKIFFEPSSPMLTRTRFPVSVVNFVNSPARSTSDEEESPPRPPRLDKTPPPPDRTATRRSDRPKKPQLKLSPTPIRARKRAAPRASSATASPMARNRRTNAGKNRKYDEPDDDGDNLSLARKFKISQLLKHAARIIQEDKENGEEGKKRRPIIWEDDEDRVHLLPKEGRTNSGFQHYRQRGITKVSRGVETEGNSCTCARMREYILTRTCARSRMYKRSSHSMMDYLKVKKEKEDKITNDNIASMLLHQQKFGERLILMPLESKSLLVLIRYEGNSLMRPSLKSAVLSFLRRKVEASKFKHPGMKVARMGGCILELMPPVPRNSIPVPEAFLSRIKGDCLVLKACLSLIPGEEVPFRTHSGKVVRFPSDRKQGLGYRDIGTQTTDDKYDKRRHLLHICEDEEDETDVEVVSSILDKLVDDVCQRKLCDLPPSKIKFASSSPTTLLGGSEPSPSEFVVGEKTVGTDFASPATEISSIVPVHRAVVPGISNRQGPNVIPMRLIRSTTLPPFQSSVPAVVKVKPITSEAPPGMKLSRSTSAQDQTDLRSKLFASQLGGQRGPKESPVFIKVPLSKLANVKKGSIFKLSATGIQTFTPPPQPKKTQAQTWLKPDLEPIDTSKLGHTYNTTTDKKPPMLRTPVVAQSTAIPGLQLTPGSIHYQVQPTQPPPQEHKRRKAPLQKRRGVEELTRGTGRIRWSKEKILNLEVSEEDIDVEDLDHETSQAVSLKEGNMFTEDNADLSEPIHQVLKHRSREQHRRKVIKTYFTRLADLVGAKYATKTTILDRTIEEVEKAKHGNWVLTQQVANLVKKKNTLTSKLVKLKLAATSDA